VPAVSLLRRLHGALRARAVAERADHQQREAHKEQCDHEADKAREIAWAEKQAQGTELGRIREVVRRSKLTREQKAAEEEARKRRPPPERMEARQMGISDR
jgi:hypothetical protein